jgi:nucleotide-binding universal stress UspA family protein
MTQHILCPTDGSYPSQHAADCAIDLARSTGAAVTFLTVDMRPQDRIRRWPFWGESMRASVESQISAQLDAAANIAKEKAFDQFDCMVAAGSNAADAIVAFADTHNCDHIVMGTGITNGLQRLLLGSVATDVVSHAHCPVTVVH